MESLSWGEIWGKFCNNLDVQVDNGLILVFDLFLHLLRQLIILLFIPSHLAGWEERKVNEKKREMT